MKNPQGGPMKIVLRATVALLSLGLPVRSQAQFTRIGVAVRPVFAVPTMMLPTLPFSPVASNPAPAAPLFSPLAKSLLLATPPLLTPSVMALPATPKAAEIHAPPARRALMMSASAIETAAGPAAEEDRSATLQTLFEGPGIRNGAVPTADDQAVPDSEVLRHLDAASRMSSAWAGNEMIETYYQKKSALLTSRQVVMLLSGLRRNDPSSYDWSNDHDRAATFGRIAESQITLTAGRLRPSEALEIAALAAPINPTETNLLIKKFFDLNKTGLAWNDVKLLLSGLVRNHSSSWDRPETYFDIANAYISLVPARLTPATTLELVAGMRDAWQVNYLIREYFTRDMTNLSPNDVQILLSGLEKYHSVDRNTVYYNITDAYVAMLPARLTPTAARRLAAGMGDAWQTNCLIEKYFLLNKTNLSWDDVKLLLAGLLRNDSKSYGQAGTQDRILLEWEKIAR